MSKDNYLRIFSSQMEAIVFIILQIFCATCEVFICLDQLRVSEKI